MADENEPIGFWELFAFWRNEAKLYAFSAETRTNALLIFLASVIVLIVLYLNPQWFGAAEDELKVRSIEFAVVLFFFPALMALDMFFRGGHAGVVLKRRAEKSESTGDKEAKKKTEKIAELIAGASILRARIVQSDAELTKWETEFKAWETIACDRVDKEFGESEMHIFAHPQIHAARIPDSWGDGHNQMRLLLGAQMLSLEQMRQTFQKNPR